METTNVPVLSTVMSHLDFAILFVTLEQNSHKGHHGSFLLLQDQITLLSASYLDCSVHLLTSFHALLILTCNLQVLHVTQSSSFLFFSLV